MFRFILMKGVIGWGIPTALMFTVLQYLLYQDAAPQHILRIFIIFALGGIPYGALLWQRKGKALSRETMLYWAAIAVCLAMFFVFIKSHATYVGALAALTAMVILAGRLVWLSDKGKA